MGKVVTTYSSDGVARHYDQFISHWRSRFDEPGIDGASISGVAVFVMPGPYERRDLVDEVLVHLRCASTEMTAASDRSVHETRDIIQFVDKTASPSLLPIFRSRQQAELLALLLGDPDLEIGLTELASRLDIPYPSAHREVERAESAGLLLTRRVGRPSAASSIASSTAVGSPFPSGTTIGVPLSMWASTSPSSFGGSTSVKLSLRSAA